MSSFALLAPCVMELFQFLTDTLWQVDSKVMHNCRVKTFPDGSAEVMASDRAVWREAGWTETEARAKPKPPIDLDALLAGIDGYCLPDEWHDSVTEGQLLRSEAEEDARRTALLARSKRRASVAIRDLALANPELVFFVTFTLSAERVDRYDYDAVYKKLRVWLDNHVRRDGLKYILVAELHKDGAIHFHGLINDVLERVDSGTVSIDGKKPRKPRSARQRQAWIDAGGQVVYNLPAWPLGFSTAIHTYGERRAAVHYITKYVTKSEARKVGGRWYYHGGDLVKPEVWLCDVDFGALSAAEDAYQFEVAETGGRFCILRVDGNPGEQPRREKMQS